jgi:hypothetical protein
MLSAAEPAQFADAYHKLGLARANPSALATTASTKSPATTRRSSNGCPPGSRAVPD